MPDGFLDLHLVGQFISHHFFGEFRVGNFVRDRLPLHQGVGRDVPHPGEDGGYPQQARSHPVDLALHPDVFEAAEAGRVGGYPQCGGEDRDRPGKQKGADPHPLQRHVGFVSFHGSSSPSSPSSPKFISNQMYPSIISVTTHERKVT